MSGFPDVISIDSSSVGADSGKGREAKFGSLVAVGRLSIEINICPFWPKIGDHE
jgi:hypothetical protein